MERVCSRRRGSKGRGGRRDGKKGALARRSFEQNAVRKKKRRWYRVGNERTDAQKLARGSERASERANARVDEMVRGEQCRFAATRRAFLLARSLSLWSRARTMCPLYPSSRFCCSSPGREAAAAASFLAFRAFRYLLRPAPCFSRVSLASIERHRRPNTMCTQARCWWRGV